MKKYVYKDAYPQKVFRGVLKEKKKSIRRSKEHTNKGLEHFAENSELNIVRKFLLKDLLRNHNVPLSRATLIVDSIFRMYDSLVAAYEVNNSMLTTVLIKVDSIVDRVQNSILKKSN